MEIHTAYDRHVFSAKCVCVYGKKTSKRSCRQNYAVLGGSWLGCHEKCLVNGGEFSNHEMREVASILNVETCITPSESPWSSGLCEKNRQITDRMLEILEDENPNTDLDTLLAWENLAKNSLQLWNGFSSFQLVLDQNPNLPNIMTDGLPALHGSILPVKFWQSI